MAAAVLGTCAALVGATIGWFLVYRVGRRPLLIVPMFATALFLAIVGFHAALHLPTLITVCFFAYLPFYGVMSILGPTLVGLAAGPRDRSGVSGYQGRQGGDIP